MTSRPLTSKTAPETVGLIYRQLGPSHIFTSVEFPGVFVFAPTLYEAMEQVPEVLSAHASALAQKEVRYLLALDFEQFQGVLGKGEMPFLLAKRTS